MVNEESVSGPSDREESEPGKSKDGGPPDSPPADPRSGQSRSGGHRSRRRSRRSRKVDVHWTRARSSELTEKDQVDQAIDPSESAANETEVVKPLVSAAQKRAARHGHSARRKSVQKKRAKAFLNATRILSLLALVISGYLATASWRTTGLAGCGGSEIVDCDHVLNSKWAMWVGIPVSVFAMAAYAGIFALSWLLRTHRLARSSFHTLGLIVGASALWFIALQLWVVQKLCLYCLAVHGCGLGVSVLIVLMAVFDYRKRGASVSWAAGPAAVALSCMAVLMIGQATYHPPEFQVIDMDESIAAVAKRVEPASDVGSAPDESQPAGETAGENASRPIAADRSDAPNPPAPGEMAGKTGPTVNQYLNDIAASSKARPKLKGDDRDGAPPKSASLNSASPKSAAPKSTSANRSDGGRESRSVSIMRGTVAVDLSQFPLVGDREAREVFVKLFDYSCPDCRRLHRQLDKLAAQLGEPFAVVLVPVPMNENCNAFLKRSSKKHQYACEYSRIALAVWLTDAEKFEEFHQWMMRGETPPPLQDVINHAQRILNGANINELIRNRENSRAMGRVLNLYQRCELGIVPKLFVRNRQIVGAPEKDEEMITALTNILAERR